MIIDFESNKVFDNADTYTAITFLSKENDSDSFIYKKSNIRKELSSKNILFASKNWFELEKEGNKLGDICSCQYGFATNADKIFIKDSFDDLEDGILRDIVKGSKIDTGKIQKVIFPYKKKDGKYVPLTEEELKKDFPKAYNYLYNYKEELGKRSLEKNTSWFEFARSQSIQAVDNKKLVIKHIIDSNDTTVTYKIIEAGTCVYSGLYITADSLENIEKIIKTEDFCKFLKENGKDLSGGYKNFNTKTVKNYIY